MNRYSKLGVKDGDWEFWSPLTKLGFALYDLNFNESLFDVISKSNSRNATPFVQWLPQSISVINPLAFSPNNYRILPILPEDIANGSTFQNIPLDRSILNISSMISSYGKKVYLAFGDPRNNNPSVPYKQVYQRLSSFFEGGTLEEVNARLSLYGLNTVNIEALDTNYFPLPKLGNLYMFFLAHEDHESQGYYPGDDLVDLLMFKTTRSPEESLDNLYLRYEKGNKDVALLVAPEEDEPRIVNDSVHWAKDHNLVGFLGLVGSGLERSRGRMIKLTKDNYFFSTGTHKPWIVVDGIVSGQKVSGTFPLRVRATDDRNISEITCYVNGKKFLSRVTSDRLWINTHEVPKGVCDIILEAKDDLQNMSLPYRLRVIVESD